MFVAGFCLTIAIGLAYALPLPDVYESKATFVVRPTSVEGSEIVRAFDTLIRGVEINATYAAIARSDLVKGRAAQRLETQGIDTTALTVGAEVVTGTNIVAIDVRGEDPEAVAAYASAIGEETVGVVEDLEDVFRLQPLDSAAVAKQPVGPNRRLTVGLFTVLGAALGVFGAIGVEAWSHRRHRYPPMNVVDPKTGLPNADYFRMRLAEEIRRTDTHGYALTVAIIWVVEVPPGQDEPTEASDDGVMAAAGALDEALPAAVIARVGDGFLGALLAEIPPDEAKTALAAVSDRFVAQESARAIKIRGRLCEYRDGEFIGDDEALVLIEGFRRREKQTRGEPESVSP